jgi:mono/diheme cytochrome c family protein
MARWQGARFPAIALLFALAGTVGDCSRAGLRVSPSTASTARAQPSASSAADISRGLRVLKMQGCVACHSLDGSGSAGPSFAGRWGTEVQVRDPADGSVRNVPFDRGYLVRSLEHPDAELALGFAPGVMPSFALTPEQTDAVVAALGSLEDATAKPDLPLERATVVALVALVALAFGLLVHWRRNLARMRSARPPGAHREPEE